MPVSKEFMIHIVSKVKQHLEKQGKVSLSGGACVYWNRNKNLKCAVGCLIDEKFYSPKLEGDGPSTSKPVQAAIMASLGLRENPGPGFWDLCKGLQIIHDDYGIDSWGRKCDELINDVKMGYFDS